MRNLTYKQAEQILNDGQYHTEMEWRGAFRCYAYRAHGWNINEDKEQSLKDHYDKIFYDHCNDMFKPYTKISGFDALILYDQLKEYGYKYPMHLLKSMLSKFMWLNVSKQYVLRMKIDDLQSNINNYVAKGDIIERYEK